jgi:hypothetical protein
MFPDWLYVPSPLEGNMNMQAHELQQFQLRMPPDLHAQLKKIKWKRTIDAIHNKGDADGISMHAIILSVLREVLNNTKKQHNYERLDT